MCGCTSATRKAGPTGYDLHRQIIGLGHECDVVAPSLIPKRPGERVKNNRRDAVSLNRLHRAGELTAVWVPDETHEAVRDLVRAREGANDALKKTRQQLQAFPAAAWSSVLWPYVVDADPQAVAGKAGVHPSRPSHRAGGVYPGNRGCRGQGGPAYQTSRHDRSVLVNGTGGGSLSSDARCRASHSRDLRDRNWRRQALRDSSQLMAYLGLVPSEYSTGEQEKRGGITKQAIRGLVVC